VKTVLQICQNYHQPFLDCTRQYAALFKGTDYRVVTVFICGQQSDAVITEAEADEVIFLEHHRDELDGLKLNIIKEIRAITAKYEFQACIAHRNKATYLALIATNLPVLSVHHAFGDFDRLGRRLLSRLYRKRLTLLAVSNAVRDEIRKRLPSFSKDQIVTLYNRVNVSSLRSQLLDRKEARRQLSIPENAFVIANVGRLHPDKDQLTLIKGFAQALISLPANSLLIIIGKGKHEQKLRKLIAELKLEDRVILTGHVNNAKKLFRAFDLFVLSSDHEPFGMVLLEAMAADLPVVCSDCGGGPEVVDGVGTLFEFGKPDALSKALLESIETHSRSADFAEKNRQKLELFSDHSAKRSFWSQPRLSQVLENER
jgi:glycosyltransferase involved in cell wall biosynthesis